MQDAPRRDGRIVGEVAPAERLRKLSDELLRKPNPFTDSIRVVYCLHCPLDDAAQVQRDAIGGFGGSQLPTLRDQSLTQFVQLGFELFS
ncbi:MAG: hypothetical protein R3B07_30355 [Polyangiaceae bacterium]